MPRSRAGVEDASLADGPRASSRQSASSENQIPISRAADSSESEPWTRFCWTARPQSRPRSPRMVPGAATVGSVAPGGVRGAELEGRERVALGRDPAQALARGAAAHAVGLDEDEGTLDVGHAGSL